MSSRPKLILDWCSHEAAKYAVMHWHYSRKMPSFKLLKVGVWEDDVFIGCVIFALGAAPQSHRPYGIKRTEICELVRIALNHHKTQVSRIMAIALKMLKKQSPGLRLVVSYADPEQGHHGGIYKAGGWIYTGKTGNCQHFINTKTGTRIHAKTLTSNRPGYATELKKKNLVTTISLWKHKYLFPLDAEIRKQIEELKKPYPVKDTPSVRSVDSDTPTIQAGEGGANPTRTLLVNSKNT